MDEKKMEQWKRISPDHVEGSEGTGLAKAVYEIAALATMITCLDETMTSTLTDPMICINDDKEYSIGGMTPLYIIGSMIYERIAIVGDLLEKNDIQYRGREEKPEEPDGA